MLKVRGIDMSGGATQEIAVEFSTLHSVTYIRQVEIKSNKSVTHIGQLTTN